MRISVAGLPVEWQDEYSDFVSGFSSETDDEPVMSIRFERELPECHGVQYIEGGSEHTLRLMNSELLTADKDWCNATAYFSTKEGEYALALAAMCSKFAFFDALLLHASCVDVNGEGVVFTGASGIGKTTQASLWGEHLGAQIINGDKIFIRKMNGEFCACGLPWKGSSEYCLNKTTRLKGVVVLRQSEENRITSLNQVQALELFMPHVFMPHWDKECLGFALETFGRLIESVPVLLLECRPDEDAVKITYNRLFG